MAVAPRIAPGCTWLYLAWSAMVWPDLFQITIYKTNALRRSRDIAKIWKSYQQTNPTKLKLYMIKVCVLNGCWLNEVVGSKVQGKCVIILSPRSLAVTTCETQVGVWRASVWLHSTTFTLVSTFSLSDIYCCFKQVFFIQKVEFVLHLFLNINCWS